MVSINVDETALRDMRPEIDSTAAIRLWAQELIDLRIKEMKEQKEESLMQDKATMNIEETRTITHQTTHKVSAMLDHDMTPEELYNVISDEIDYIYAKG